MRRLPSHLIERVVALVREGLTHGAIADDPEAACAAAGVADQGGPAEYGADDSMPDLASQLEAEVTALVRMLRERQREASACVREPGQEG